MSRKHRNFVRADIIASQSVVSTRVEAILSLLIESGIIYCALWVLYTLPVPKMGTY